MRGGDTVQFVRPASPGFREPVRADVKVLISGIRGPTTVAVENVTAHPAEDSGKGGDLVFLKLDWPDLVDINEVVYFLEVQDGRGRIYNVSRLVQRRGNSLVVEATMACPR